MHATNSVKFFVVKTILGFVALFALCVAVWLMFFSIGHLALWLGVSTENTFSTFFAADFFSSNMSRAAYAWFGVAVLVQTLYAAAAIGGALLIACLLGYTLGNKIYNRWSTQ